MKVPLDPPDGMLQHIAHLAGLQMSKARKGKLAPLLMPASMSWAKPRIALSGVRNSWLTLDRKSDFARLAFSATDLALSSSTVFSYST